MRITYRSQSVKDYWNSRWTEIPGDSPMANEDAYPLKFALQTVGSRDGAILEAGCGAGRILRYYHERGFDIRGIDCIEVVVAKLREIDPTLQVEIGDITRLQFPDGTFRYVLAFGLFHSLEHGLDVGVAETLRVLEPGGLVVASFRADNITNRISDWLSDWKSYRSGQLARKEFHKANMSRREFSELFQRAGFIVESVVPVENMPIFYKFSFFRSRTHKVFNETLARSEGWSLSGFGSLLQGVLMRFFPDQFCNLYVLTARRP